MPAFKIRRAKHGDEEQIAKVHIQSWQETYKGLVSKDYLDKLPEELVERIETWKNILNSPNRWAWVATVSDSIVGFILFGPPRDEDRETFIELGAIYLLSEKKGKGIGFALLSSGFEFMKTLNYQKAYCWVLENNPSTLFYEKCGANCFGQTKMEETAGQDLKELAYEWATLDLKS